MGINQRFQKCPASPSARSFDARCPSQQDDRAIHRTEIDADVEPFTTQTGHQAQV
jgi:hypothetical protein